MKKTKTTNNELKEPSEYFQNAVSDCGSLVADCDFCGRTHFATYNSNDFDEGELEDLRVKAEKEPDKYIEWDCSSISQGRFNGKQVVVHCSCNKLRAYEDWIWSHRYIIMDYFENRIQGECKSAEYEKKRIEAINKEVL